VPTFTVPEPVTVIYLPEEGCVVVFVPNVIVVLDASALPAPFANAPEVNGI
jgi:hypothetical protein